MGSKIMPPFVTIEQAIRILGGGQYARLILCKVHQRLRSERGGQHEFLLWNGAKLFVTCFRRSDEHLPIVHVVGGYKPGHHEMDREDVQQVFAAIANGGICSSDSILNTY